MRFMGATRLFSEYHYFFIQESTVVIIFGVVCESSVRNGPTCTMGSLISCHRYAGRSA